jgi:hypothetical protein
VVLNSGKRHQCEIQALGEFEKGDEYQFRPNQNSEMKKIDIKRVKEFGVENEFRFLRQNVSIDISDGVVSKKEDIDSSYKILKGSVFLLELIKARLASLYMYVYQGEKYFFYKKKENEKILPLYYKKYTIKDSGGSVKEILYDNSYLEVLKKELPCSYDFDNQTKKNGVSKYSEDNVMYNEVKLIEYFRYYNESYGYKYIEKKEYNSNKLKFNIFGGFNSIDFFQQRNELTGFKFDTKNVFSFGGEVEYMFEKNNNMFGVFTELSYLKYKNDYKFASDVTYSIDYSFLEIPLGIMYKVDILDWLNVYAKASLALGLSINNSYIYLGPKYDISTTFYSMFAGGIGFGPVNLEFDFYPTRNVTKKTSGSEFDQMKFKISVNLLEIEL